MLYILQNQEKKAQPQAAWSWQVALWPLCMQVRCTEDDPSASGLCRHFASPEWPITLLSQQWEKVW